MLLLVASLQVSMHLRTQGMLAVEAALPLRVRLAQELSGHTSRVATVHIPNSSDSVADYFGSLGYRLSEVRTGADVPRVFLASLPPDLDAVQPIERRKALFLRTLLPLVLRENEQLRRSRARLLGIRDTLQAGAALDLRDRQWLARTYARFHVEPGDLKRLLRRVDVVPASLALAQAAMESGWGTSRFVKEGNALFGMWTWSDSVPGIVPAERPEDASYRVRAFQSLGASVSAYVRTLNTHWAYVDFRDARARLRRAGKEPDGLALLPQISQYSERRGRYTANLRALIRNNGLPLLDGAALSDSYSVANVSHALDDLAAWAARRIAKVLQLPAMLAQDSGK